MTPIIHQTPDGRYVGWDDDTWTGEPEDLVRGDSVEEVRVELESVAMKKAYYARPMNLYGTPQEGRDKTTIRALGYEPIEINKPEIQAAAKEHGMAPFEALVKQADAMFFRAFVDGSIGAGVAKEIAWAEECGMPVVELPGGINRRTLSVDDTRALLRELGQR